ncbi:hypothetical protein QR680_006789 [Steinernema hermaphroditum]|uniref:Non-specific protein-tyrosine kinase n=1 Tax=Steinernema hermaphroditum TaxID=289476 RepID=A0AA39HYQ9_9BILA|nr:hypothetical protein QR680_006789 [Steinernema hermaphroditum]
MEGLCTNDSRLIIGEEVQPDDSQSKRLIIGVVYLILAFISIPICLFDCLAFCRKPYINQSCYKLLTITTILDVLNLVNNALIPGFLSIFNVTPCNGGHWTVYFGFYHILIWTAYCSASEVLAINRVMIFVSKRWSTLLYEGRRTWLWMIVILTYVGACVAWVPDAKYIYDPNAGVIYDWHFNQMHVFNNFFKMGFLTTAYVIMLACILYQVKGSMVKKESSQIKISLITLSIAALADIGALGYMVVGYLPKNSFVGQNAGVIAELCWIALHAGTGIIYLCFNQAVRDQFRVLRGMKKTWVSASPRHERFKADEHFELTRHLRFPSNSCVERLADDTRSLPPAASRKMKRDDEFSLPLPFFHGALLDEDVDKLLVSEGDYLIQTKYERGHMRPRLYLVIKGKERTRRVDIQRVESGFRMCGKTHSDVRQLIEFFVPRGIEISDEKITLRRPVPKGKFQLVHKDIKLQKKIGSGAYGTVYKGVLNRDRRPVAVKRIESDNRNEQGLVDMMKEARVMQLYDHPNIVKFYGYIVDRSPYLLVMELCQDGSVEDKLRTGKNVSTARRVDMCMQAARGLEYLHHKNCIHRDIAARNCLLQGTILKLADFGMCRATTVYKIDLAKPQNVRWLAPEVWRSGETRFCTDVYAFGVMLWEMFVIPYSSPYCVWKAAMVKEKVMAGYRMPTPESMPDNMCTLMKKCWDHDPARRPTAAEVRNELEIINKVLNDDETPQTARLETSSMQYSITQPPSSQHRPASVYLEMSESSEINLQRSRKNEVCDRWRNGQMCPFGTDCRYAHEYLASSELPPRTQDALYRTVLCRHFIENNGRCPYGERCMYAHGPEQLRKVPNTERRGHSVPDRICHSFLFYGTCPHGNFCRYNHLHLWQIVPRSLDSHVRIPKLNDVRQAVQDLAMAGAI